MLNTYNRFRAQPPTLQALGQRLIGNRRGVQQKMPVKAPPVQKFFNDALAARGMPLARPAPYALATSTTRGLAGLGDFGSFSNFGSFAGAPLFDEFEFEERWSADDFFGRNPAWVRNVGRQMEVLGIKDMNYGPVPYTPADSSFVAQTALKWNQLKTVASRDSATRAFMADVRSRLRGAIAQADQGTKIPWNVVFGRRTTADEQMRVAAFEAIQDQLERINSFRVPSVTSPANTTPGGGIQSENQGSGYPGYTGGGSSSGGGGTGQGQGSSGGAPYNAPAAPSSNTGLYVGGGIAVLAVGAAAYFLLKK